MIEEKEMVMVSPTGGDPFRKNAYFLKPILPDSSIYEPPFNLPHCFSSLAPRFDPKKLELQVLGWRSDHQDLQSWFLHLASKHQSTWKKAGVFEAIFNSTYQIKRKKDLVCGFAEKWCCETNTFIFPWGEATITLEDVMVLGGFSVLGDSILSPIESRELKEIEDRLEEERFGLYNREGGIRVANTYLWTKKFMKSGSELEHEAFLVFWLSRYVFHNSLNAVNKAVFSIAIRLARGIRVALAPAILSHIYRDLGLLKRTIASSDELNAKNAFVKLIIKSQFQLVQIWAWERFLELRPKPKVICYGEPRLARWDKVDCLNVGDMRRVLDSAGEGFMWRPYAMVIKNWNFPKYYVEKEEWVLVGAGLDDELLSFAMCLRVAELVGFDTIQHYLPHRVARQFGFDQDLPCSVPGHIQNYDNAKLYILSRLSEADVSIRYLNWWKESVSGLEQRHMPSKKKVKKSVDLINDATIPCICSPKNSEELVQVSAGRNEGEYSFGPPGFSLKRNRMEAGDPIDEDDLTISEALKLGKKLKTVETRKSTDSAKLSSPDQIFASSSADESSMNIMKSKILEKEVVLSSEVVSWGSKGQRKLDKVIMSKERSPSNDMVSIVGSKCPSSLSLSDKLECGCSMSLFEKRECASSSSLFEKQECTSSGSLFAKLECASINPSIADEGTYVNTKKSERLEKGVPLIKALIWGGKGKRKMKNVMRSNARSSSLFEKWEDGSSSMTSYEKRVSELKAKVYRLEKVVQVLKANTFGKS
ncbi:putative protein-serine/threonine phosphatase [Rosa chinensis]|uniref:Aminotransferase-like plant mobile domain-containing protein n=1 Tax=Rosa chinensis TaxID=74649 RepID=A0A2P6QBZ9_ROSCH|nr:uncharacterized protein LOC112203660 [Rosa chinensis]PRQ31701.1 putative protein-serine/threonine phosphatase [Rosa chinensis]